MMHTIRRVVYRLGLRPKPPSIFHSPSLSFAYGMGEWITKAEARDIIKTTKNRE